MGNLARHCIHRIQHIVTADWGLPPSLTFYKQTDPDMCMHLFTFQQQLYGEGMCSMVWCITLPGMHCTVSLATLPRMPHEAHTMSDPLLSICN